MTVTPSRPRGPKRPLDPKCPKCGTRGTGIHTRQECAEMSRERAFKNG